MSHPNSPTRRRPVPPPKTQSEEQLRAGLTSPGRQAKDLSNQHEQPIRAQSDTFDPEAQKREAMKHLTLPPGWDLRNEVDVTYHIHVAKPVVHETIHQITTEVIEPKITRDIHYYHQYDYIQPLEAEVPENSYATNPKGEVIHAPGGLGTKTQTGASSHWEQERQDRGYGLTGSWKQEKDLAKTDTKDESPRTDTWDGRDRTDGPFPIQAEGGGERILESIRSGALAQRFAGPLTSPSRSTSHPNETDADVSSPSRTQRAGSGAAPLYQQPDQSHAPHTPQRRDREDSWAAGLEKDLNRLSLQQSPEVKPLPALPDTSAQSKGSVRRMSGDNKLRNRYSIDSSRTITDNPTTDNEGRPDGTSSVSNARKN